ncbi:MAG TPA: thioredoxin domain-containing protein [Fibrobacteria bacterium]|jgi:protein-disulfide isomerase|nr:thioredoxin domain-containing protein [Fibrobacteria bacterium]
MIRPAKLLLAAALSLGASLSMNACSSTSDARLRAVEARQDSILAILHTMQSQSEFVALRVGWRPPADTAPKDIPVGTSFTKGPEKALVTIVEFSDLQCPYCAQLVPTLDAVAKAYPNDVRLVYKHFPLSIHPQARAAAAAAIAAGKQGHFFEFRSATSPHFRNLSDSLYLAVANSLGLDMAKFRREMPLTAQVNDLLEADMELGQQVGVQGTPTVFINGRLAEDRSFEYFAGVIEREKAKRK